jgi:hypothetical protein
VISGLVVGSATYPGFRALDELVAIGVPLDRIRVHLGHTRESGTRKHPIVRYHPMLHSKIYYMEMTNDTACAFIGSHNVTSFALQGLNGEAAVLIEGSRGDAAFNCVREHIQTATGEAVPYSPGMKEAFAWWTKEFIEGLSTEVDIPKDWSTVRTILIFASAAAGDRPNTGEHLYFEIPTGIEQIESLKTEVHLFLFSTLPPDPWEALQRVTTADASYTCKVLGAENLQGNLLLKADWRIETQPSPVLGRVASGVLRPATSAGMQQVRAEVHAPEVVHFEYLFEREKRTWWPSLSEREELHPEGGLEESFPISDTRWQKATTEGWRLVMGLKQGEGSATEKDQLALELAKPDSGSFILVSLRRRRKDH